ncbi:MAG: hypothetical protein RI897_4665 [Verrucomicrobiota bacterium]|jgi:tRNA dimethylallyltransferase
MKRLIVIVGANASGKSELGIRLAKQFGGEVVSADSRQVYRGLDIGSGKVTLEEAGGVRHYMMDVAGVEENFTLARYQAGAYAAIDSICERGGVPILVGGTGLYISAVVEGYRLVDVTPNAELRAELEALTLPELVARLERVDPGALADIDRRNPRRLVRAIEVAEAGYLSSMRRVKLPRYACCQLGVTWPREILVERIEKRLRDRLSGGLIEEVVRLREGGVSDRRLEQLGLEYRYVSRYLRGELRSREELTEQLGIAIRQYAKEQMTWFRRDSRIRWLDMSGDPFREACERIVEWG